MTTSVESFGGTTRTPLPFPSPRRFLRVLAWAFAFLALLGLIGWKVAADMRFDPQTLLGAPPAFVRAYAQALCGGDVDYLMAHTGGQVRMPDADAMHQAFEQLDGTGRKCLSTRYLGRGGQRQPFYVYVFSTPSGDQWWVFTFEGETVVDVQ